MVAFVIIFIDEDSVPLGESVPLRAKTASCDYATIVEAEVAEGGAHGRAAQ